DPPDVGEFDLPLDLPARGKSQETGIRDYDEVHHPWPKVVAGRHCRNELALEQDRPDLPDDSIPFLRFHRLAEIRLTGKRRRTHRRHCRNYLVVRGRSHRTVRVRLWEAVGVGHHRPSLEQIDSPRNSHDSRGGASDVLPESKHSADSDCRALVLGGVIASKQHSRSAGGLIGEVRRWRGWGCRSVTGRRIARHLGRCRSVISREIRRNTTKTRGYQAVGADVKAQRRRARPQQRKVATDPVMQARVEADLAASWTPNEIAGVAACAWRRQTRLSAVWRTLPTRKAAPSPVRRSTSTSTRPHVVSSPGGDLLAV